MSSIIFSSCAPQHEDDDLPANKKSSADMPDIIDNHLYAETGTSVPRATSIYNLFLTRIEVILDGKFFVSQTYWKPMSKWSDRREIKVMGIESYSIFIIDSILCCTGLSREPKLDSLGHTIAGARAPFR